MCVLYLLQYPSTCLDILSYFQCLLHPPLPQVSRHVLLIFWAISGRCIKRLEAKVCCIAVQPIFMQGPSYVLHNLLSLWIFKFQLIILCRILWLKGEHDLKDIIFSRQKMSEHLVQLATDQYNHNVKEL